MNDLTQLLIAIGVILNAIVAIFGAIQSVRNGRKSTKIAENVQTIEKATNSMKDALVAATAKASLAEGTAAGLVQGRREGNNDEQPIKVDVVSIPKA